MKNPQQSIPISAWVLVSLQFRIKLGQKSWRSGARGTVLFLSCICAPKTRNGLVRDLNPGPLAPKARIIPLDQRAAIAGGFSHIEAPIYINDSRLRNMLNWRFRLPHSHSRLGLLVYDHYGKRSLKLSKGAEGIGSQLVFDDRNCAKISPKLAHATTERWFRQIIPLRRVSCFILLYCMVISKNLWN